MSLLEKVADDVSSSSSGTAQIAALPDKVAADLSSSSDDRWASISSSLIKFSSS